ncbi:MAG: hypothetical protein JWO25_1209 [Alphaproteobacteria bacterium]|nr:hypothetical protein [Alphaproteobacteria bacterium]
MRTKEHVIPAKIEQVRIAPGNPQPCPGDMAACSMISSIPVETSRPEIPAFAGMTGGN